MRLEPAKSFKRKAMGDGTHGLFILGPSGVLEVALSFRMTCGGYEMYVSRKHKKGNQRPKQA